jgi:energy-coupling factor transport system substrate-specific component
MTHSRMQLVRVGPRSAVIMSVTSLIGLLAFTWPLVVPVAQSGSEVISHSQDAPWMFVVILPLLAAVVLAQIAEGGMDAKVIALLGMLTAVAAGLRALSPGAAGLEPGFFLLILAGYAFGPGFGFVFGALGMFTGGLLTGGIGPWLPFQMFAAAWSGAAGGLLPRRSNEPNRAQIWLLAGTGLVGGLLYGLVMNLWFWPFATFESALSFQPGDTLLANLERYWKFWLATSFGWDLPRGIVSALLTLAFARTLLRAFARVSRRAAFGVPVRFTSEPPGPHRPVLRHSAPSFGPPCGTPPVPPDSPPGPGRASRQAPDARES